MTYERGILVRSLREGIDTSTPTGRVVAGIFASLAEYERVLITERASAARAAVLARGQRAGRKPVLTKAQITQGQTMRTAGESVRTIMATFPATSRSTAYRLTQAHAVCLD